MVSFWPWKGDNKSPASFEKILSDLSIKISKTSGRLDGLRQRSRRLKVLWTLYAGFTYLLYTIISTLVVGWRKWGPTEYAAVIGGPVIVYFIRFSLTNYYEYRISNIQSKLHELQRQRDRAIEKLKAATKYNDTQDLLKKYGGAPASQTKPAGPSERKTNPKRGDVPRSERTVFVPPPTANIPGRDGLATPINTPQRLATQGRSSFGQDAYPASRTTPPIRGPVSPQRISAELAPSAFSAAPQYSQANKRSQWYDRIMDALLGEDETLPTARLALICNKCRLVNGQAPPGVKRLEDVGKWRCGGCGAMNGEESEAKKIVASIRSQPLPEAEHSDEGEKDDQDTKNHDIDGPDAPTSQEDDHETDSSQYSSESSDLAHCTEAKATNFVEPEKPRRPSTRSQGGKKTG